jgi:hypothetical protein
MVNLMDALRRSIAQEKRVSAPAKKGRKRIAGQTEMLVLSEISIRPELA